ncbi:MAG: hypothetical protein LC798_07005 [Chloroflexi bacterium]|nr:hypothetical protein [Chloroflexota bacterium]
MTPRRVVITGIGAITPIGSGADGLWKGVMADASAVRAIDRFDASIFPSRIAAQIDDFEATDHLDARRARRLDRFSALSVAASRMAFEDAGLDRAIGSATTGVWIGSALGGIAFGEAQHTGFVARGIRGVAPTLALAVFGGAGASNVALDLGLTGPSVGNANSCASGAVAIGQAFGAIRDGTVLNAHGSSTPLNEPAEARAIRAAFGAMADRIPVSGTKGLYGHALGASGAIEAAITAMALEREMLPGTCNLEEPDPTVDLKLMREATPARVDAAVSTSFGFGGMNAALVLASHER